MTNLIHLRPAAEADSIFFSKADLRVGASLRYYGRNATRGRLYFVERIRTIERINGLLTVSSVQTPVHLVDLITLREATTGRIRELTFGYLSYSAIWRLEV